METTITVPEVKKNEAYSIGKVASNAVFLGVIGVASQVVLLSYQIAFLKHLKIPSYLVETTIAKSVATGFVVLSFVVLGWNALCLITEDYLRPKGKARPNETMLLCIGLAVVSAVMYFCGFEAGDNFVLTASLYALVSLSLWINASSIATLLEKPKPLLGLILVLCILVFIIPIAIGGHKAKHERDFFVFNEAGKSFAVIDRYGEYLIAIPHDPIQNTVGPGFKLIKMEKLTETLILNKSKTPPRVLE